ncbi:MAG: ABC transporter ATP-binding protein [Deltaproteobacteria bacterium]|nr:MAG: ABC transporter ATP-binding protein [Deltaproteobacteria bacterium]
MSVPASAAPAPQTALRKMMRLLTPRERRQLLVLAPAVALMGLVETLTIAAIVPFLALLSNPASITEDPYLAQMYVLAGSPSTEAFFFAVGIGVLVVLTLGNAFSALTTWGLLRFSWMRNHSLSSRLLEAYANKPYSFFLEHNTSGLTQRILSEVQEVVARIIVQSMLLVARTVVVAFILIALLIIDPALSLGVALALGLPYGLLFLAVRNRLHRLGEERVEANRMRFKLASELLTGIKEVKLAGLERAFLARYAEPSSHYAASFANAQVISQIPRYALETVAFGGLLLVVLYLLWQERELVDVLPFLGLYAFASVRMLPGLQIIFSGLSAVKNNLASLDVVLEDLPAEDRLDAQAPPPAPLPFSQSVALRGVSYLYARQEIPVFKGLDLCVERGQWVAFVGPTGSGKSTLVSLLLGLLSPHEGALCVDGRPLAHAEITAWQRNCGYVPQQMFLADDTIEANIAFGVEPERIDRAWLRRAAQIAQIHTFIEEDLPKGYRTVVGERGLRLSGGQRQRLGIARALYRRPALLVLDEATSALDGATEEAFFVALRAELRDCTVLSIAHRLTTTRDFDRIFVIDRGRVADDGTFEELRARHPMFTSLREDGVTEVEG